MTVSFWTGTAGTGKTTALKQKLVDLLEAGEPAYTILVLVAEPAHRETFFAAARASQLGTVADLKVNNYIGLGREFVRLFWPLVARKAGFATAVRPPTYLGYDLAQLLMWEIVTPMLEQGHFADLRLRPQQIVSQLLDNLNRSALNNLTITAGIERQINSWVGEVEHIRHLRDAGQAANTFRQRCHANNLLDLSLTVEVFNKHVVEHPEFSRYFQERFRHMLVDNLEEQTAAGQNFVRRLMGQTVSTTLVFDQGGGYKTFMAADPNAAEKFRKKSQQTVEFTENFVDKAGLAQIANEVDQYLFQGQKTVEVGQIAPLILGHVHTRYRREMLVQLGPALRQIMDDHQLQPRDITIVAPYLDGALRYKLTESLRHNGIPYQLSRRRASPREEPHVRAWLTWLALAHPDWEIYPTLYDMAEALQLSIHGLDPVRAALVAQSLYQPSVPSLRETMELTGQQEARIGSANVDAVGAIRQWLAAHGSFGTNRLPLPEFIHQLFTELLSSASFNPRPDEAGAAVCEWLTRTAVRLQEAAKPIGLDGDTAVGRAFVHGIQNGLVAANPPDLGDPPAPDGVRIAPIYSFLLSEQDTAVQVWLETSATGWWDMPRQPLSNTFVLAQSWEETQTWTMADETRIRNELLGRVVRGLTSRCRLGIVLATSDLDRRGQRQENPLWRALHTAVQE